MFKRLPIVIKTDRGYELMPKAAPSWLDPTALRNDYKRLQGEVKEIEEEMSRIEALAADYGIDITDGNSLKDLASMTVRDATVKVLEEDGTPLSMGDLYTRLVSRGLHIKGEGPAAKNNLYASIVGDPRVMRVGQGRGSKWGLKAWQETKETEGVEEANQ